MAWPTRAEVINYSIVVLMALVLLTAIIFGLDYVFAKAVIFLFKMSHRPTTPPTTADEPSTPPTRRAAG